MYTDIEKENTNACGPEKIQMEHTWWEDGKKGGLR